MSKLYEAISRKGFEWYRYECDSLKAARCWMRKRRCTWLVLLKGDKIEVVTFLKYPYREPKYGGNEWVGLWLTKYKLKHLKRRVRVLQYEERTERAFARAIRRFAETDDKKKEVCCG